MFHSNLFALDLGTTKFCLAFLRSDKSDVAKGKIDLISIPAEGMHRGMLANFVEARNALQNLLKLAEENFGVDISRVVVGIAGNHLTGATHSSSVPIKRRIIDQQTIRELISKFESQRKNSHTEILHTIPISYHIDGREPIEDPIGFSGNHLFGEFFVLEADRHYLKDTVRLCNECGLEVQSLMAEPFASASVTGPASAKQRGCVIADIGGGTTDGIVFLNGKPRHVFSVSIAGNLMTKDLAFGLGLPFEESERVKRRFGLKHEQNSDNLIVKNEEDVLQKVSRSEVYPILAPRVTELLQHLYSNLRHYWAQIPGGIYYSGGGSELQNLAKFSHSVVKLPCFRSAAELPSSITNNINFGSEVNQSSPKYATVIGLINLELCRRIEDWNTKKQTWPSRYLNHFMNWIKDLS